MTDNNEKKSDHNSPLSKPESQECCSKTNSCACTVGGEKGIYKFLIIFVIALIAVTYVQNLGGGMSEEAEKLWNTDIEKAQNLARESNKPLLISFHIPKCIWCDRMKSEVYSSDSFCSFASQNLVLLLVNGYKNREFAKKYNINGFPSYVLLNPEGEVITSFSGYMQTDSFISRINTATGQ